MVTKIAKVEYENTWALNWRVDFEKETEPKVIIS